MKLMTKEVEQKLEKYGYYGQEDKGFDSEVLVKYFNPSGAGTWLITGGEKMDDGDWLLFGYCHITDAEWGDVMLSQIESYVDPMYHIGIERDMHVKEGTTVAEECKTIGIPLPGYYYEEQFEKETYQKYKEKWCTDRGYKLEDIDKVAGINGESYVSFSEFINNEYCDVTSMMLLLDANTFDRWKGYMEFEELADDVKYPYLSACHDGKMLMANLSKDDIEFVEYNLVIEENLSDEEYENDSRYSSDIRAWINGGIDTVSLLENYFNVEDVKCNEASIGIYQMKSGMNLHGFRFEGLDIVGEDNINMINYDEVYKNTYFFSNDDKYSILEDIYYKFNVAHPYDFRGHSLSVSDVVVMKVNDGPVEAYYCDIVGFKKLDDKVVNNLVKPSISEQMKAAQDINKNNNKDINLSLNKNNIERE